jgi:ketosteroid isomerase-like protein
MSILKHVVMCILLAGTVVAASSESRSDQVTKLLVQIQRVDYEVAPREVAEDLKQAAAEQHARASVALIELWPHVKDILISQTQTAKINSEIIGLERAALERWGKGDPQGYLELMAPEVTYFDPSLEKRLDGLAAVKEYIIPFTGKIRIYSYEMINPQVQRYGDVAVLTFNLVDSVKRRDREEKVRWNSTEVYRRIDGNWKIIHSHWSFIKPQLKETP